MSERQLEWPLSLLSGSKRTAAVGRRLPVTGIPVVGNRLAGRGQLRWRSWSVVLATTGQLAGNPQWSGVGLEELLASNQFIALGAALGTCDGCFKPAAILRAEFEALLGQHDPATVVHHCGSGVSAVPNLLAMEIAGLGHTAVFAGSWSEWCSDPQRPVAQG